MNNFPNNQQDAEQSACPSPDVLQRAARDETSPDEQAMLDHHLDQCAACQQRLDALLDASDLVAELRRLVTDDGDQDWDELRAADVPQLPYVEMQADGVVLSNGLRLAPPRARQYLASLGRFDVLAVIAHGGMGTVLRAWDDKLQREVALKVIGQRWLDQPTARQRFLQEARAAAGLRHPNIVTIHEVDEVENVPFIVMEYVCGKSLDLLIAEERQLASDRAARIARETLTALEHAHGHGIIHRDVKPGNILLEEPGERVRLVDFGLARSLSDAVRLTGEGFVPGTPWYMSPEQASGSATADKRSDLFAVGVVLFEMLTGTLPFPGQDVYRVLEQIRAEPAPEVREFNPAVPSALATIVRRALEKSPAARYQSAAEFAGAIGEFLAGLDKSVLSGAPRLVSGPSGPATGAAGRDRDFPRCSVCRRTYFSKLSVTRVCLECQAPICDRCWEIDGMIPRRAGCGPG